MLAPMDRIADSADDVDATRTVDVLRCADGASAPQADRVAVETPVALVFNGISHAVMMATPRDLDDFALGFALTEGLVDAPSDVYGVDAIGDDRAIELKVEIAARMFVRLKARRRSMAGPTGCGLCGIDDLDALDLRPGRVARPGWIERFDTAALARATAGLAAQQPINATTGAVHAAGFARPDGSVVLAREDVGRHNALDKLLGALARAGIAADEGFVVMSSRASVELVRKCARRGVPLLATISAPTSLAVDVARDSGIQLHGFCRGERSVRYAT